MRYYFDKYFIIAECLNFIKITTVLPPYRDLVQSYRDLVHPISSYFKNILLKKIKFLKNILKEKA